MNNYSRLEINLLPPELLPGPTVRYAMLINFMIIMLAATFIGVSWYLIWMELAVSIDTRRQLEDQIQSKAHIEADFTRLNKIGESIDRYGRLVALASEDYVDMPVILDRMSQIIPDKVFLQRVTNTRTVGRGQPVVLGILFTASKDDPDLMLQTLQAFKQDPIFADCFMPAAEYDESNLDELMDRYKITWSVSGPEAPKQIFAKHYVFEIHAQLQRPLTDIGRPFLYDTTDTFTWDDFKVLPQEEEAVEPEPVTEPGEAT